jgi:hypothetical protein
MYTLKDNESIVKNDHKNIESRIVKNSIDIDVSEDS